MDQAIPFLLRHGYTILLLVVLAEQLGLPIPAVPVLLAMGALAGSGRFSFSLAVLVAVSASLISDVTWYQLGRRRGRSVLKLVCRISLEPDYCVRRTECLLALWARSAAAFEVCPRTEHCRFSARCDAPNASCSIPRVGRRRRYRMVGRV